MGQQHLRSNSRPKRATSNSYLCDTTSSGYPSHTATSMWQQQLLSCPIPVDLSLPFHGCYRPSQRFLSPYAARYPRTKAPHGVYCSFVFEWVRAFNLLTFQPAVLTPGAAFPHAWQRRGNFRHCRRSRDAQKHCQTHFGPQRSGAAIMLLPGQPSDGKPEA